MTRSIPVVDFADYLSNDEARRNSFIEMVGDSLKDIGFFALKNHGIPLELIHQSYENGDAFFGLDQSSKSGYSRSEISHQRGYTAFGVEHAKDNLAPDLKEFWQTGRGQQGSETDNKYPMNIWPNEHIPKFEEKVDDLYNQMETISNQLLSACSIYLGKDSTWLPSMAEKGNTIMRIIHYPPLDSSTPEGAVRSAAHEDINFITLLMTATAAGLQVMDHDGHGLMLKGIMSRLLSIPEI